MEYSDEKRRLFKELIVSGAGPGEFKTAAKNVNVAVPSEMLERWRHKFYSVPTMEESSCPRLINRFLVGADPEFIFKSKLTLQYLHAEKFGLNQLQAFGADMSGRQAELRVWPSHSTLEVTGSIMEAMRWLNESTNMESVEWRAPAIILDAGRLDGIGGHIHIGRRRPGVQKTIDSLDALTRSLSLIGLFDRAGQAARAIHTIYGREGDYRSQVHGFEYRTMPTWINSPFSTFLALTLSKLAVIEDFVQINTPRGNPQNIIYNILRAYQNVDDDARLALIALERMGPPLYKDECIKQNWAIRVIPNDEVRRKFYAPPVIKPSETIVRDLFQYFSRGKPLPLRAPEPTWTPFVLPLGYYPVDCEAHVGGAPDVAMGLISKGSKISVAIGGDNKYVIICGGHHAHTKLLMNKFKALPAWKGTLLWVEQTDAQSGEVIVPASIYNREAHAVDKNKLKALRAWLTDPELFPIAKYTDFNTLAERKFAKKNEEGFIGRMIEVQGEQD